MAVDYLVLRLFINDKLPRALQHFSVDVSRPFLAKIVVPNTSSGTSALSSVFSAGVALRPLLANIIVPSLFPAGVASCPPLARPYPLRSTLASPSKSVAATPTLVRRKSVTFGPDETAEFDFRDPPQNTPKSKRKATRTGGLIKTPTPLKKKMPRKQTPAAKKRGRATDFF